MFTSIKKNFFIIFYFLITSTYNYVIFNLKKFENVNDSANKEYSPENLIINLFNRYYSFINIGNPPQKTEVQLSKEAIGFVMKEDICLTNNYYNKNKSLSLIQTHNYDEDKYSKRVIVVNETIDFPIYNSETKKFSEITISDFSFIYNKTNETVYGYIEEEIEKEKEGNACIILGLQFECKTGQFFCKIFPDYLKEKGLTSSHNFFFLYNNDKEKEKSGYDSSLIIGENPHNYNKEKYHEDNYIKSNALNYASEKAWALEFHNYFYSKNGTKIVFHLGDIKDKVKGIFWFDLDIIIGISKYLKEIKENYFDYYQKECKVNSVNLKDNINYEVISCDKEFDTKDFPNLYFYHSDYNYTFELTEKDLFQIRGDQKYFLIVFDKDSNYPWKFGKLFMKKYFFNFDVNSKTIGFYKDLTIANSDKKFNNKLLIWILFPIILIIFGVGGFFLGKMIYNKNRKKRANELDDDYEYQQKNKEEKLKDNENLNKLGID